ncbi:hypothetical protein CN980_16225 [Bacillus cereus]|uniref:Uncharacterized protein n=1 Tax=Bacillus cereus TaxID=1396 RepID=A0A9X7CAK9_BACCE|nr:hypothetical protein CN980_16225 [Bacillus cereus]
MTPENKVFADASTKGVIFKATFGNIYDKFLQEPFSNWLSSWDAQYGYNADLENIGYKAPEFKQGQFAITVFNFYKNQDFCKRVKLLNPDGTTEIRTINHGEQLIIKQPGTLVKLNYDPSAYHTDQYADGTQGNYIYVTQSMIDQGNLGISIANWQTFYLEKANTPSINLSLILKFYPRENPGNFSFDAEALYNRLDPVRKAMATVTSNPIDRSNFINKSNSELTFGQLLEKAETLEKTIAINH